MDAFTDIYLSVSDDLQQFAMVLLRISISLIIHVYVHVTGMPPNVPIYLFVRSVIVKKC